jgi:hypothetical protein
MKSSALKFSDYCKGNFDGPNPGASRNPEFQGEIFTWSYPQVVDLPN